MGRPLTTSTICRPAEPGERGERMKVDADQEVDLATQGKTLYEEDLEHVAKLDTDGHKNPLLNPSHTFTIIKLHKVGARQHCAICDTRDKAETRVTVRNDTLDVTFYAGLDCLEMNFGVTRAQLERGALPLKLLAQAWQKFLHKLTGKEEQFVGTVEAVEHMYGRLKGHKLFSEITPIVRTILDNLPKVQAGGYTDQLQALQNLLGIIYEQQADPEFLEDRAAAFSDHPKLQSDIRELAGEVLRNTNRIQWTPLLKLSKGIAGLTRKPYKPLTPEAPADAYASAHEYSKALETRMKEKLIRMTKNDELIPLIALKQTVQERIKTLIQRGGGTFGFAIENANVDDLLNVKLNFRLTKELERNEVVFILADGAKPYERIRSGLRGPSRQAMLREGQEEPSDKASQQPKTRTGYFRGAIMYKAETYRTCHAIWNKYGGMTIARRRLEDLTSNLK